MAYRKIPNLYQYKKILEESYVWALEKIHGTSANISYKNDELFFYPGGSPQKPFEALFDKEKLLQKFRDIFPDSKHVIIYGEHYGGNILKASDMYGTEKRFIVFEVKRDNEWLRFGDVIKIAEQFDLDLVEHFIIPMTMKNIDEWRDRPSAQAIKLGIGDNIVREGIVLRSIEEKRDDCGRRLLVKHKADKFRETKTRRTPMDPFIKEKMSKGKDIAEEYVTEMRLQHVLDKFPGASIEQTGHIIRAMLDDIITEHGTEFDINKQVNKAIASRTVMLFKRYIAKELYEQV